MKIIENEWLIMSPIIRNAIKLQSNSNRTERPPLGLPAYIETQSYAHTARSPLIANGFRLIMQISNAF